VQIGIKYCGGCREHYDRRAAAKRIKSAFSDTQAEFDIAEYGGSYDALLAMYGCGVKCADISWYQPGKIVAVDSIERVDEAEQELMGIYREG